VSLDVLGSEAEIRDARAQLTRDGLSCLRTKSTRLDRFFRRLRGRPPSPAIGEPRKSWDVLHTAELIGRNFSPDARVLDLGAYQSEMLLVLQRKGFRRLTGVDLDPRVVEMPRLKGVRWEVADFMATRYLDGSFEVITAISAIEHGFDAGRLLSEVSRLLVAGGYFIASFDYWPQKVSTEGINLYGLSWTIFSREEVLALIERAAAYGLRPVGPLRFEARERPIRFADRDFTFAWLALRKDPS
jgi:SAM-dependent methyltransferase